MQTAQSTHVRNLIFTIDAVLAEMLRAPSGTLSQIGRAHV